MPIPPSARTKIHLLCGNIALAFAYYGTAELSRWLASTPQNVTPVWPPDGIAVAAVFLFGPAFLPGVCLGSFLSNIWAFWDPSSWSGLVSSLVGVVGIAVGTTIGTGAGVYGLKKTTRSRYPLDRVGDVVKFLLFAGLLGPVINAIAGVAVLCSLGIVPWSSYHEVWLTWWISNVAGIFIVTPAIVSWAHWLQTRDVKKRIRLRFLAVEGLSDRKRSRQNLIKLLLVEVLLIAGLIITVGGAAFWQSYEIEYLLIPLLIWALFDLGKQVQRSRQSASRRWQF